MADLTKERVEEHIAEPRRHPATARLFHPEPAKLLVMNFISLLVADGFAAWEMLDSGEIELRFSTGETFPLAEQAILRIA